MQIIHNTIGAVVEESDLLRELQETIQMTRSGIAVQSFSRDEIDLFMSQTRREATANGLRFEFLTSAFVFQIADAAGVGEVFDILFNDPQARIEYGNFEYAPSLGFLSPWPCFLMPTAVAGSGDGLTYLGEMPIPYVRFSLEGLYGLVGLSQYSLFEPFKPDEGGDLCIDLLREGAIRREMEFLQGKTAPPSDAPILRSHVEKMVLATKLAPNDFDDLCIETIPKLYDLRDDLLEFSLVMAVGFGMAKLPDPPWWLFDRINLSMVCATAGLKQDWCGKQEEEAWVRLCQGFTRTDRWFRGLMNGRWNLGWTKPPTETELLRQAVEVARGMFDGLFSAAETRRNLLTSIDSKRPTLVATKVDAGWMLFLTPPGGWTRHALIKESKETNRKSRILIPLLEKMSADIATDIPANECGWVAYEKIAGESQAKKSIRLRKDESDLNKELQPLRLSTETKNGQFRLHETIATSRMQIIIKD